MKKYYRMCCMLVASLLFSGIVVTSSFGGVAYFENLNVLMAGGHGVAVNVTVDPCRPDLYLYDFGYRELQKNVIVKEKVIFCNNFQFYMALPKRENLYINPVYLTVRVYNDIITYGKEEGQWSEEDDKIVQEALKKTGDYDLVTGDYIGN